MRVDLDVQIRMREERLLKALERARAGSLRSIGYSISQIAKAKIKRGTPTGKSRGRRRELHPSRPGDPPHTRRGRLRFAIRYALAPDKQSVVIGPMASIVGDVARAHEFGGRYGKTKAASYPKRPFMGPSLQDSLPRIGPHFEGSVHA